MQSIILVGIRPEETTISDMPPIIVPLPELELPTLVLAGQSQDPEVDILKKPYGGM